MTASALPTDHRRTFSLRVHVATLVVSSLLLAGGTLAWLGYRSASTVLLSATNQLVGQVTQGLDAAIRSAYGPAATTVDLLSRSTLTRARNYEDRWAALPLMVEGLINSPQVAALYASYASGDFFIVRPLTTQRARERYEAPAEAAFVVNSTEFDENRRQQRVRVFFDDELIELERRRLSESKFDATTRPWYRLAIDSGERVLTEPYLFNDNETAGVTVSRRFELGGGVVAADVTLEQLSQTLAAFDVTPSAELVLLDHQRRIVAHSDRERLATGGEEPGRTLSRLDDRGNTPLAGLARHLDADSTATEFRVDGRKWTVRLREFATRGEHPWLLALLVPKDELLSEANRLLRRSSIVTAVILLAMVPIGVLTANIIARPLQQLAGEAGRIRRFDFGEDVATVSRVKEVHDLAASMNTMKNTIERFLGLIGSLSREQSYDLLLDRALSETMQVCHARGGVIYLLTDDESALEPVTAKLANGSATPDYRPPPISLPTGATGDRLVSALAAEEVSRFTATRTDQIRQDGLSSYFDAFDAAALSFTVVPLYDRRARFMGNLCLVNPMDVSRSASATEQEGLEFVVALSGFAAVSIESRRLLKMEKELLDAFIRLIAGAIDAKSPYTGGHCQRVPALTMMLANAASESEAAEFADFHLGEEQWEALHIACWLHDCGKVTTPEYVVDKATKLETIYDRIHEVRMRFEVLKRDAEIRCWRSIANGAEHDSAREALERELCTLDDEFAFVAQCNEGGEFMAAERIERLHSIGARTWQRTLDDRAGISWEERLRKQRTPVQTLPATENLLSDKQEHVITREDNDSSLALAEKGFVLEVPEHAYNRGELYNLSIARGTLSNEERFKINDHIVQTILMLEELPFPRHLRTVPEIAGGHHEKMDGTGYPKRLHRDDMPLTARMMAIADIFEALTASDRPYKKAKKLSEAIRIMGFMKKDQHIDPQLFDLFLESGVYTRYASEFLDAEQIDEVDIAAYRQSS